MRASRADLRFGGFVPVSIGWDETGIRHMPSATAFPGQDRYYRQQRSNRRHTLKNLQRFTVLASIAISGWVASGTVIPNSARPRWRE
jgi:hypothetical protein